LKIRIATAGDIPAIQALEKQADTAAHWSDDIYHSFFAAGASRTVLVADDNDFISAFIVARVVGDDWEIENLVVARHLRRRGIGSALIHTLVQQALAAGARQILLEVRHSNAPARDFYVRSGFVEGGRRKRYYRDPDEDAVCYSKELNRATRKSRQL
jgi:[ribosomal protein S18]-alanine N-acetyltransferase